MTHLPSLRRTFGSAKTRRSVAAAAVGTALAIGALLAPQAATAAPLSISGVSVLQEGQRPVCTGKTSLVTGALRDGNTLSLRVDNSFVSSNNRYIVTVDGAYVAEAYKGSVYYSRVADAGGCSKKISTTVPNIHAGSTIEVFRSSGQPGWGINNLETIYRSSVS